LELDLIADIPFEDDCFNRTNEVLELSLTTSRTGFAPRFNRTNEVLELVEDGEIAPPDDVSIEPMRYWNRKWIEPHRCVVAVSIEPMRYWNRERRNKVFGLLVVSIEPMRYWNGDTEDEDEPASIVSIEPMRYWNVGFRCGHDAIF